MKLQWKRTAVYQQSWWMQRLHHCCWTSVANKHAIVFEAVQTSFPALTNSGNNLIVFERLMEWVYLLQITRLTFHPSSLISNKIAWHIYSSRIEHEKIVDNSYGWSSFLTSCIMDEIWYVWLRYDFFFDVNLSRLIVALFSTDSKVL